MATVLKKQEKKELVQATFIDFNPVKKQKNNKNQQINILKTKENIKHNKSFDYKKQKIIELAKKYIAKNGTMDMSTFRKEQPSAYSRLNYYFNGVSGLLKQISPTVEVEKTKKASGRGCPINAQSVRNELAFDMLLLLREKHTLEEIGKMYGVSRAHIHQLLQVMDENTYLDERPFNKEDLVTH
jgi:hypothetical protein